MTIQEIKQYLKNNKITYQDLSERSGIALNTLKKIFRGKTENPRIDTMQAIERALGLENEKTPPDDLSEGERQWLKLYNVLTTENKDLLVQMVASFNDMPADRQRFVLSAIRLAIGNQK